MGAGDPHVSYLGNTYANPMAAQIYATSTAERPLAFPVGSIIVREKLIGSADAAPDRLAVMVKRAPGFSPASGDWEFFGLSGDGATILERQTTGSCISCHTSQKSRDYVFTYEK